MDVGKQFCCIPVLLIACTTTLRRLQPATASPPSLCTSSQAAANAKQNLGLRKSKLVVSECYANEGPVLKRFEPRAKGRAYRINKYLTHITIKVAESA